MPSRKPVTGLELVVYYGNAGHTIKYKKLSSALRGIGFSELETREIMKLPKEDIEPLEKKMYIEKSRIYHPDVYKGTDEIMKDLNYAHGRVKHLLPKHRSRENVGYVDAMCYANVRF